MAAQPQVAAQAPTPPLAGPAFEVRWDEGTRLFRVWNTAVEGWAHVPGFTDERVARAVAASLLAPPKGERPAAKHG